MVCSKLHDATPRPKVLSLNHVNCDIAVFVNTGIAFFFKTESYEQPWSEEVYGKIITMLLKDGTIPPNYLNKLLNRSSIKDAKGEYFWNNPPSSLKQELLEKILLDLYSEHISLEALRNLIEVTRVDRDFLGLVSKQEYWPYLKIAIFPTQKVSVLQEKPIPSSDSHPSLPNTNSSNTPESTLDSINKNFNVSKTDELSTKLQGKTNTKDKDLNPRKTTTVEPQLQVDSFAPKEAPTINPDSRVEAEIETTVPTSQIELTRELADLIISNDKNNHYDKALDKYLEPGSTLRPEGHKMVIAATKKSVIPLDFSFEGTSINWEKDINMADELSPPRLDVVPT